MPDGGMVVTNNDVGTIPVWDPVYDTETFEPHTAVTVFPAGTLLGRITATGDVTPWTTGATHGVGSDTIVGILGTAVTSDAGPADEQIRMIVGGRVDETKLVRDDAAAITDANKDALRDFGIIALPTANLSKLDNQ